VLHADQAGVDHNAADAYVPGLAVPPIEVMAGGAQFSWFKSNTLNGFEIPAGRLAS